MVKVTRGALCWATQLNLRLQYHSPPTLISLTARLASVCLQVLYQT